MASTRETWLQTSINKGITLDDLSNSEKSYGAHIDWKLVNKNLKKLGKEFKVSVSKGRYDTIGLFTYMGDEYEFIILNEDKVELKKQTV